MNFIHDTSSDLVDAAPFRATLTRHAEARIRQRAFRDSDIDVLLEHGSEMSYDKLTLTDNDVQEAISRMKRGISRLERLRGMTAVIVDGRVITVYKTKTTLRRRRSRREG